ncbi:hypothetical protein [Glutamicibacter halophytocola]|uniref:hypothetical protein n=1 Tax=Glutamicibacter halophytocola TaxID=1933880 RepID=UPI0015C55BA3|nr:hypothetical protein [Glutamicibacter halophytocola]NQD42373.1 hypothetical protein [Glutamicibacter halophytocola]
MTNQASEELRRAIGECLGIFPEEFDEYLPNNVGKKNIDAIEHLIRNEKLKLLAEVRERVVGEDEDRNHRYNENWKVEVDAQNYLRKEQRAALTKLKAEL